jgi:HK97 family phage major capsid protein
MAGELEELTKSLEKVQKNWNELKELNDKQLAEAKKTGAECTELKASVAKCNEAMAATLEIKSKAESALTEAKAIQTRMDNLETVLKRGGGAGGKELPTAEMVEVKSAMERYIRRCDAKHLDALIEKKALSVGTDPDGGYFVTPDMNGRIVKRVYDTSPLRQWANVQTINTESLEGFVDIDQAQAGWVAETTARAVTNTPQIGKWRIGVNEMYAKPQVSQKLLEDSSVNVDAWVSDKIADRFARLENTSFFTGTGVGQPRGILSYTDGITWGFIERQIVATTITADGVINLVYKLKEPYRRNARMLMTRTSHGLVRLLKDTQNRYIWQPAYEAGAPATVLGFPVHECADMEEASAGAGRQLIAFGDFNEGYQIVDRAGISMLRDPYSAKPYVEFYARKRVGGDVVNFEAIKIYQRS